VWNLDVEMALWIRIVRSVKWVTPDHVETVEMKDASYVIGAEIAQVKGNAHLMRLNRKIVDIVDTKEGGA